MSIMDELSIRSESWARSAYDEITQLRTALAESQAREAKLRNLLLQASCWVDLDQMDGGYQLGKKIEAMLDTTDNTALREMIAAEREACARVCEEMGYVIDIAAAIRARK